jgi:signal transduction histidine kinase
MIGKASSIERGRIGFGLDVIAQRVGKLVAKWSGLFMVSEWWPTRDCPDVVYWRSDSSLRLIWRSHRQSGWRFVQRLGQAGDVETMAAHADALNRCEAFRDVLYEAVAPDGDSHWFRVQGQPKFRAKRTFDGYRGSAICVTQEVATLRRCQRNERMLHEAVDGLSAGLVLLDARDRVVLVNRTLHRLAPELAVWMTPGRDYNAIVRETAQATDETSVAAFENPALFRSSTSVAMLLLQSGRLLQVTGRPMGDDSVLLSYTDVTDLKAREAALAAQSQLLETTLDNIQEAICLIDIDQKIIIWNKQFIHLFGFDPVEIYRGCSIVDIFGRYAAAHPLLNDNAPVDLHDLAEIFSAPGESNHSFTCGNRTIELRIRCGADGGHVLTFADITEHRRAETEMASRAKTNFLANMSHELRTPLNAIIGFSEILKDELLGPIGTKKYLDYVRDIHMSGEHLLAVINDILDLSKVESGKVELYEISVDLRRVIQSASRLLRERATRGELSIRIDIPSSFPALLADERAVKQILINLLSNAVKFTDPGGTITLAAALADDGGILLSVADNGIGMRPDDVPKVLAPFAQLDSSLTRRYSGTGLGLPLVKSLIELHGGRLDIETQPGRGTTVKVGFPPSRVLRPDPH